MSAEEELRRRDAMLAAGQRICHTGTWTWNVASRQLSWSAEHFRIFGLEPARESPPYDEAFARLHPDDRARVQDLFERAVHDRTDYACEFRVVRPDGSIRYVDSLGYPVVNDQGDVTDYVGAIVDRTEQRLADARIRDSERRFRLLAEAIPHHVWSDGRLSYWNQRLIDYLGVSLDTLQRGAWDALHPDDRERMRAVWEDARDRGAPYEIEFRLRAHDGSYRRFLSRAVPVGGGDGTAVQWFNTNTDIEDRRRAEDDLRDARAALAQITRMTTVGELAASLAHELNQPFAAIVTNGAAALRWLDRDSPNLEQAIAAIERVIRNTNRAADVIANVRTLLMKAPHEKAFVDLCGIVQDVLSILEPELTAHHIVMHQAGAGGPMRVMGRKVELQQVVLNLVMNAIEAMADVAPVRELSICV
jgi:PAS domain S-box-containing protein